MQGRKIEIKVGGLTLDAEINDSQTAGKIFHALPITGVVNMWGDEIYFSTSLALPAENPKETVQLGDIAYWLPGKALCIFFGLTPMSTSDEIRPAGAVTIIGKIVGDLKPLKKVKEGETIEIFRAE